MCGQCRVHRYKLWLPVLRLVARLELCFQRPPPIRPALAGLVRRASILLIHFNFQQVAPSWPWLCSHTPASPNYLQFVVPFMPWFDVYTLVHLILHQTLMTIANWVWGLLGPQFTAIWRRQINCDCPFLQGTT